MEFLAPDKPCSWQDMALKKVDPDYRSFLSYERWAELTMTSVIFQQNPPVTHELLWGRWHVFLFCLETDG